MLNFKSVPEWWNWQTRCVQGAVGFTPVRVRVSPPAPSSLSAKTHLGHRFIGHITKTNLVENAELEAK